MAPLAPRITNAVPASKRRPVVTDSAPSMRIVMIITDR